MGSIVSSIPSRDAASFKNLAAFSDPTLRPSAKPRSKRYVVADQHVEECCSIVRRFDSEWMLLRLSSKFVVLRIVCREEMVGR